MKIAICVPAHLETDALFTRSLSRMLIFTVREQPDWDIEVFLERWPLLQFSRNLLVRRAMEWGADRLLLLDADHTFPVETLQRLMGHQLPLVACNYLRTRVREPVSTIRQTGELDEYVWTTQDKFERGLVEEVTSTGLGVCLVDAAALRDLDGPLFNVELASDGSILLGEDAWFFRKLRERGVKILIDHRLSWFVWHVSRRIEGFQAFQPPGREHARTAHPEAGDQ